MKEPDAFGRAFPDSTGLNKGMTLRDWFAGLALSAIVPEAANVESRRGKWGVQACAEDYAQIAYILADAMCGAREAKR